MSTSTAGVGLPSANRPTLHRRVAANRTVRCAAGGSGGKGGGDGGLKTWFSGTLAGASKAQALEERQRAAVRAPARTPQEEEDQAWRWWFALPLQPFGVRKTLREEIVPGQVWGFDQPHGGLNIVVNIRMAVVKMQGGGLWVHAPVAPTRECRRLLDELVAEHGPVRHIVHPTYAVEHKVFVGAFSRAYPEAEVWVAPGQWSFPLNLPIEWLGLFPRKARVLPEDSSPPWGGEFQQATLSLPGSNFVEAAFCHRPSRTLLCTDLLQCAPREPPPVILTDPLPLLLTQRADGQDLVEDTDEGRLEGWQKTALLALFIRPDAVNILDDGGFEWRGHGAAFEEVAGEVLVAPILSALILNRQPGPVIDWARRVGAWDFERIVPGHLGVADAGPEDVLAAFDFLGAAGRAAGLGGGGGGVAEPRGAGQLGLLSQIDTFLVNKGLSPKP